MFLYSSISTLMMISGTGLALAYVPIRYLESNSGSTVGRIANGQQIPLPTGFSASQCSWSVSNAENLKAGSRFADQLQLMMQIELLNVVFMMNTISIKEHLELI